MKLKSNLDDKYNEDWTKMKHEFAKQTENIDKLSKQYSQLYQEHNKKLHSLATENTKKFEQEKENLLKVSKENRQCCICLCNHSCYDTKTLRCGHEFHESCINEWLRRGETTCPYCRADCSMTCKFTKRIFLLRVVDYRLTIIFSQVLFIPSIYAFYIRRIY